MNKAVGAFQVRRPHLVGFALAGLLMIASLSVVSGRPVSVAAQATPSIANDLRTITVNGRGGVMVTPDAANVIVGVESVQTSIDEAQAEVTTRIEAVMEAARTGGVEDADIQTFNYSIDVIRDYDSMGNPTEIQGYRVSNQVRLMVRDLDTVGSLLASVVDAGANSVWGINFLVTDPSDAASAARAAAVEDARVKAEELATLTGTRVVGIVSVVETFAPAPASRALEQMDVQRAGFGAVPVEPGSAEIVVELQITFEIETQ